MYSVADWSNKVDTVISILYKVIPFRNHVVSDPSKVPTYPLINTHLNDHNSASAPYQPECISIEQTKRIEGLLCDTNFTHHCSYDVCAPVNEERAKTLKYLPTTYIPLCNNIYLGKCGTIHVCKHGGGLLSPCIIDMNEYFENGQCMCLITNQPTEMIPFEYYDVPHPAQACAGRTDHIIKNFVKKHNNSRYVACHSTDAMIQTADEDLNQSKLYGVKRKFDEYTNQNMSILNVKDIITPFQHHSVHARTYGTNARSYTPQTKLKKDYRGGGTVPNRHHRDKRQKTIVVQESEDISVTGFNPAAVSLRSHSNTSELPFGNSRGSGSTSSLKAAAKLYNHRAATVCPNNQPNMIDILLEDSSVTNSTLFTGEDKQLEVVDLSRCERIGTIEDYNQHVGHTVCKRNASTEIIDEFCIMTYDTQQYPPNCSFKDILEVSDVRLFTFFLVSSNSANWTNLQKVSMQNMQLGTKEGRRQQCDQLLNNLFYSKSRITNIENQTLNHCNMLIKQLYYKHMLSIESLPTTQVGHLNMLTTLAVVHNYVDGCSTETLRLLNMGPCATFKAFYANMCWLQWMVICAHAKLSKTANATTSNSAPVDFISICLAVLYDMAGGGFSMNNDRVIIPKVHYASQCAPPVSDIVKYGYYKKMLTSGITQRTHAYLGLIEQDLYDKLYPLNFNTNELNDPLYRQP